MIDIGSVWDRTTEVLGENLSAVLPLSIAAIFIPTWISSILAPLGATASSGERLALYGAMLLVSVWSMWGKLTIIALSLAPDQSRSDAARTATRRLGPAIVVGLALLILCALLCLPVLIALAAGGFDFQAAATGQHPALPHGATAAFIVLYGLVMAAILLATLPRLALVTPVIIAEGLVIGAIMRSVRLTGGVWLKVLGVFLLYLIVLWVSAMATMLVMGSLLRLIFGDGGPLSLASVLTSGLVAAVTTVFATLAAAFVANVYLAVRNARETAVVPL
ncbi:MAG: hypothetical protein ABIS14_13265 [Sphingomonas sp.]